MQARRTGEPGKLPAGVLAILVHLAFLAFLVFGVSWRTQSPAPVTAELWQSLPAPPKATPVLPPPEPKPEPKPEPRPEPKAEPEAPKPDIALKEKAEKLKREQEEKQKLEEERKKDLEKKKEEEQKKKEEERKKQEKLKEEQARKAVAEKEAQAKAQADQAAKAAAEATNAVVASAIDRIKAKIRQSTQVPDNVSGHPQAEFKLVLLPTGELLSVTLTKSSGNPAYDEALARGIKRAEPLPLPTDPTLFPRFRELNLPFTHEK